MAAPTITPATRTASTMPLAPSRPAPGGNAGNDHLGHGSGAYSSILAIGDTLGETRQCPSRQRARPDLHSPDWMRGLAGAAAVSAIFREPTL